MSIFLTAWAVCALAACVVLVAVVVIVEIRDHLASEKPTPAPSPTPPPVLVPRIPQQRRPSAAAVVAVHDPVAFEEFLRELIITPHVEGALS